VHLGGAVPCCINSQLEIPMSTSVHIIIIRNI